MENNNKNNTSDSKEKKIKELIAIGIPKKEAEFIVNKDYVDFVVSDKKK